MALALQDMTERQQRSRIDRSNVHANAEMRPNSAAPELRNEKERRDWIEQELDQCNQVGAPTSAYMLASLARACNLCVQPLCHAWRYHGAAWLCAGFEWQVSCHWCTDSMSPCPGRSCTGSSGALLTHSSICSACSRGCTSRCWMGRSRSARRLPSECRGCGAAWPAAAAEAAAAAAC
jgi:hypothetical protein